MGRARLGQKAELYLTLIDDLTESRTHGISGREVIRTLINQVKQLTMDLAETPKDINAAVRLATDQEIDIATGVCNRRVILSADVRSYRCGRSGHVQRQCRQSQRENCRVVGHHGKNCTSKGRNGRGRNVQALKANGNPIQYQCCRTYVEAESGVVGVKPDSLCKLYEMDENHERRMWLDKLLQFMEERGTPISACPTISKNPLDLYRLYAYVKERGGFMEVCKVTKNKTWKDIAGLLGIGASSSAAYTLRKHYTKNLLAFECHFDCGGIDPQPIINQVESTSKNKMTKTSSVPSPEYCDHMPSDAKEWTEELQVLLFSLSEKLAESYNLCTHILFITYIVLNSLNKATAESFPHLLLNTSPFFSKFMLMVNLIVLFDLLTGLYVHVHESVMIPRQNIVSYFAVLMIWCEISEKCSSNSQDSFPAAGSSGENILILQLRDYFPYLLRSPYQNTMSHVDICFRLLDKYFSPAEVDQQVLAGIVAFIFVISVAMEAMRKHTFKFDLPSLLLTQLLIVLGVGVPMQGVGDNISVSNPFDNVATGQRPNPYCPSGGPSRPQGIQQGYQGQSGYSQYPDQYPHSRGQPTNMGQEFNQQYSPSSSYPPARPMYPPYASETERLASSSSNNRKEKYHRSLKGKHPLVGNNEPEWFFLENVYVWRKKLQGNEKCELHHNTFKLWLKKVFYLWCRNMNFLLTPTRNKNVTSITLQTWIENTTTTTTIRTRTIPLHKISYDYIFLDTTVVAVARRIYYIEYVQKYTEWKRMIDMELCLRIRILSGGLHLIDRIVKFLGLKYIKCVDKAYNPKKNPMLDQKFFHVKLLPLFLPLSSNLDRCISEQGATVKYRQTRKTVSAILMMICENDEIVWYFESVTYQVQLLINPVFTMLFVTPFSYRLSCLQPSTLLKELLAISAISLMCLLTNILNHFVDVIFMILASRELHNSDNIPQESVSLWGFTPLLSDYFVTLYKIKIKSTSSTDHKKSRFTYNRRFLLLGIISALFRFLFDSALRKLAVYRTSNNWCYIFICTETLKLLAQYKRKNIQSEYECVKFHLQLMISVSYHMIIKTQNSVKVFLLFMSYGQGRGTQQSAGGQDPFGHNRYGGPRQPPGYPSRTGYPAPPMGPPAQQPTGYPPQQDYYRQDPVIIVICIKVNHTSSLKCERNNNADIHLHFLDQCDPVLQLLKIFNFQTVLPQVQHPTIFQISKRFTAIYCTVHNNIVQLLPFEVHSFEIFQPLSDVMVILAGFFNILRNKVEWYKESKSKEGCRGAVMMSTKMLTLPVAFQNSEHTHYLFKTLTNKLSDGLLAEDFKIGEKIRHKLFESHTFTLSLQATNSPPPHPPQTHTHTATAPSGHSLIVFRYLNKQCNVLCLKEDNMPATLPPSRLIIQYSQLKPTILLSRRYEITFSLIQKCYDSDVLLLIRGKCENVQHNCRSLPGIISAVNSKELVNITIESKYCQQVYSGQQAATATGPGGQMYPGSPHSKSMPPPAPQTPRRHPDFAKDPQQSPYPPYSQQRPSIYGWSSGNTQYRAQYPPQGPVPQGPPQWNQNAQRAGGPEPGQPANSQWDQHRYQASGQSPYQPPQQQQWVPSMQTPGINQNSLLRPPMVSPRAPFRPEGKPYSMQQLPGSKAQPPGMNNAQVYQQQSAPKREIVFPPESVEAILPVLYKRKRMTRGDVAPVEAWRLMMSLRSGLLAESAWALDILNILLFDDSTVAYFGLAHMPGLLDVLLEHFRRSLADMFDSPLPDSGKKWFQAPKVETPEVDLGQVRVPVDPADHITLMKSTPNYTLVTRNGEVVRIVNRDNEIFVVDNRKSWDIEGDLAENYDVVQDPWQLTSSDISSTKYIVSCFQGEFGNVPFVRLLDDSKTVGAEEEEDCRTKVSEEESYPIENLSVTPPIVLKMECSDDNGVTDSLSSASNVILNEEHLSKDSSFVDVQDSDEVKRTKTILSDVFSRIKTENKEENSLLPEHCVDPLEPPKETVEVKKEANCVESESSSNYERELPHSPNVPKDIETKRDNAVSETSDTNNFSSSNIKTEHTNNDNSSNSNESSIFNIRKGDNCNSTTPNESSCDYKIKEGVESEIIASEENSEENRGGIQIRDPAGTLKRRRMSDYEDECYTRDEASLYLVTDTQDAKARRCVCLSTILRNLTFVPGNEAEFAKNVTFLDLLGKLLLLHHEHPPRAQKQRNYDREEDADFADSCSSLQGEAEWWWDFLHHVRENVLVTAANIAGHMDLGQHPEEVSRPVIDGLLHWAVCPAAHGQDPFPGSSGSLSPQRLALEALCKLCVTDSNVDLVVATPPYSRLERLCAVLTRLLCWSEEQVLREFAVNMLHYLAAADSGVARTVALQSPCVSLLVAFIEQAEATALGVAYQHGIGALIDNPDAMGTSLDMLRRAAGTLLHLARHPENRPLFLQQEQRLLSLVMSQILDQQVAAVISSVLFQCSWPSS
ncbi:uncharacterized protein LOC126470857 [Schistocerca serialis cubense]|uniref:uncharacterized protein LOC126470857 n=1 Tax=Schistocerca serialis cubense TaxID=2023355 RepID=UPI00214EDE68|nr:uncharacterized protein LOC126470857 [Schistocerca serialis cubense]